MSLDDREREVVQRAAAQGDSMGALCRTRSFRRKPPLAIKPATPIRTLSIAPVQVQHFLNSAALVPSTDRGNYASGHLDPLRLSRPVGTHDGQQSPVLRFGMQNVETRIDSQERGPRRPFLDGIRK